MRKKTVQLMLGLGMGFAVMGSAIPCFAEDAATETESETNSETEVKSDFVERGSRFSLTTNM